ncbi:MAG: YebC/PmpR family DNA-binding transcriptional regulator [Deltaproteobacteria bacterium]|uniref:Probable transcriptional regulatory protein JW984_10660 n=1 Tax=Candidatus Zymogenus saltonus TaxID=2844893 RepID=A0A9D8KGB5_9DELT|nr:YebC/PmpR family DNA-binding transcriptional regulator [Candidatus Zymogenus saltonus]
MSGHSKWHSIKHKKGAVDAKRGKMFTKLIKEITVAARMGDPDPETNPRLRTAVAAAKAANMPKDNIERAIKKGAGELGSVNYEEVIYEGYGPAGVAVMVESLTDNKNRTVADIRYIFSKNSGNLGENGCVSWLFEKRGVISVEGHGTDADELLNIALEAGALDVNEEGNSFEVITEFADFEDVRDAVKKGGFKIITAEITMLPKNTVALEGKDAEKMLRLMDALEDNDDVQKAFANFDIPEEIMEELDI